MKIHKYRNGNTWGGVVGWLGCKYRNENTGWGVVGWDANTDADWGKLGSGATGLRTSLLDNFASIIRDYCQIKVSLRFKLLVKFAGNISTWEDAIKLRVFLFSPATSPLSNKNEAGDVWIQHTLGFQMLLLFNFCFFNFHCLLTMPTNISVATKNTILDNPKALSDNDFFRNFRKSGATLKFSEISENQGRH